MCFTAKELFKLDQLSGVLTTKATFDYESTKYYLITVRAFDVISPTISSKATLNVTIDDVNDSAPKFERAKYSTVMFETSQYEDSPRTSHIVRKLVSILYIKYLNKLFYSFRILKQ